MVFSSLFFIYAFFPIFMLVYALAKGIPKKNTVILVFSLIFYTWGEPKYVLLLLLMTVVDWFGALMIEKNRSTSKAKAFLVATCIIDLGLIAIFKYGTFFMTNFRALTGVPEIIPEIALPIGISFYTFQLLSYVVDVYRGDTKAQKSFKIVLLYVSLFHQCIAGPIVRYSDVQNELLNRKVNIQDVSRGIMRFTVGLAKKALIANVCGQLSDTFMIAKSISLDESIALLSSKSAGSLWLGVLMYSLQIYFDFSAYSDMAIGMGLMIGFHYKENFDYPYVSNSVTMFWRKWHISLSSFFRDYVYIPLGGNQKGSRRTYLNLFIVWFLTGLWHGASWNFVLWGLYFFVFLILEKKFIREKLKKIPSFISHLYLCLVVYFGWILFKFSDLSLIGAVLKGMFGFNQTPFMDFETSTTFNRYVIFIIIAVIGTTPLVRNISNRFYKMSLSDKANPAVRTTVKVLKISVPVIFLILSTMALVGNSYNPFLYFQF